jgi:N-methylhydantoinase A
MLDSGADLEPHFKELESLAASHAPGGIAFRSLDLRYAGQGYELNVPGTAKFVREFHDTHRQRYGHADESKQVEVVTLRLRITTPAEKMEFLPLQPGNGDPSRALIDCRPVIFDSTRHSTGLYDRERLEAGDRLQGPAIIVEYSATTVVPPGCSVEVDRFGNLLIEMEK